MGNFQSGGKQNLLLNKSMGKRLLNSSDDFLICRANTAALVGGCVIVDKISKRLMLSDKVLRIEFSDSISKTYVLYT